LSFNFEIYYYKNNINLINILSYRPDYIFNKPINII
jgi:hypothetical protein